MPALSIEVDDLDAVHRRAVAGGFAIEYGPVDEPWGVRRFYVRDPFGRLVYILNTRNDSWVSDTLLLIVYHIARRSYTRSE